jgi:hypothetical protein
LPAQQPNRPLQPSSHTLSPYPRFFHCRAGPTRQPPLPSPFFPFLLRFSPAAGQPSRIAQGRAMGRPRQPGGPHAEGRCVHAGSESTAGEVRTLLPLTVRIRGEPERWPRAPPAPPGERPGVRGAFPPRAACGLVSKGREAGVARTPSHQPPFGFSTLHRPCSRRIGRRRKRAAVASHRAREKPGAGPERRERITDVDHYTAGTPSTRQGRRRATPEGGGREPAGDEEPKPRRTTTGVNTYPAFVHLSTEPATTPSPPHREQPNRPLYSLLPLGLLPVLDPRCRDASPLLSCLGAGHRAAELPCRDGWSSWTARALERRRRRAMNERGLDVALC